MRVETVRWMSRSGLALWSASIVALPPGPSLSPLSGLWSPLLAYGGLTMLAFMAFPMSRRADLTGGLVSVVAALEGLRALMLWHGALDVLLQGLAAVAMVYGLSFTERFRTAAREAPGSSFTLQGARHRRRAARRPGALESMG